MGVQRRSVLSSWLQVEIFEGEEKGEICIFAEAGVAFLLLVKDNKSWARVFFNA